MHNKPACKAFNLIELSISLTIIALIISTIVGAMSLRDNYRLNKVAEDIKISQQAYYIFMGYRSGAIAGDYNGAQIEFGEDQVGNKIADGENDGNGNGNNIFEILALPTRNESLLYWQHLAAASLIEGTYDGSSLNADGLYATGKKNSFLQVFSDPDAGNVNYLLFSKIVGANTELSSLTPAEIAGLDAKYDDGKVSGGNIRAYEGSDSLPDSCVVTNVNSDDQYNISGSDETCIARIYF